MMWLAIIVVSLVGLAALPPLVFSLAVLGWIMIERVYERLDRRAGRSLERMVDDPLAGNPQW